MITKIVKVDPLQPWDELLIPCAQALRRGELVAFPTETVYGLGANALSREAVSRIFVAKGRPQDNPLIVHVSRVESVEPLVKNICPKASELMHLFWPGPLTLLFPKSERVPDLVTAGLPNVAIRMPEHPIAQRLIDLAGVPLAAPSANVSGRPSPTTFHEVLSDLDGKVEYIIDGGGSGIGVESTVLDLSGPIPRVLRPGGLPVEDLRKVLGEVEIASHFSKGPAESPGTKYRHYAPKAQVYLAEGTAVEQASSIILSAIKHLVAGSTVVVMASSENAAKYARLSREFPSLFHVINLGSHTDLAPVASRLFSALRYADYIGASTVFSESFPEKGLGLAIQNRLLRAADGKILSRGASLRVVTVCSGNTCRSPMAQGILRSLWDSVSAETHGFGGLSLEVLSRGTAAYSGAPATPKAVAAAGKLGIDLGQHRSQPISQVDLVWADLVITMTQTHKHDLISRFPAFHKKIYTLSEISRGAVKGDVSDPYGQSQEIYDSTAQILQKGLLSFIHWLWELTDADGFGL